MNHTYYLGEVLKGGTRALVSAGVENARYDAEELLGHVTGVSPRELLLHRDRELEEETGYRAKELIPLGKFYPACAYSDETIWMYLAKGLEKGDCHRDVDEFLEVELIPLRDLVKQVLAGKIPDAKTQLAILKAAAHEGML